MSIQPYSSLVQFSQGQTFLNPKEASACYERIQQLFAELAYRDEKVQIPAEMFKRIHQVDLPLLLVHQKDTFTQLLANISKVAEWHIPSIQGLGVYQIKVPVPEKPDEFYWGWIERSHVEASDLLKRNLDSQGFLILEGTPPQVLWALQRIQRLDYNVPVSCRESLLRFLDQWKLQTLKKEFLGWTPIPSKKEALAAVSLFDPEDPYGSLKRFVSRCTTQPLHAAEAFMKAFAAFFRNAAFNRKRLPIPAAELPRLVTIDLPFLREICPVDDEEETRLIASIQEVAQVQMSSLFLVECRFGENPQDYSNRWIRPPKIDWVQSDIRQLHQFVMQTSPENALSEDFGLNFDALTELLLLSLELNFPQLKQMLMTFANEAFSNRELHIDISTAFSKRFDHPGMSLLLEEIKPLLTPDQDTVNPESLRQIYLYNLCARPRKTLVELMRVTFPKHSPDPDLLCALYDQVDEERKAELVNLYVQLLHKVLGSELNLERLQGFCRQLALGEAYFIRSEALPFYHFLKSNEVAQLFPHRALLERMIDAFPRYYPTALVQDHIDRWRQEHGVALQRAFKEIRTHIERKASSLALELHTALENCFTALNTKEEMEKALAKPFAAYHLFDLVPEMVTVLLQAFQKLEPFAAEGCPQRIQQSYRAFQTLTAELLAFSQKLPLYKSYLLNGEDVVLLMNLIWRHSHSYTAGLEQRIPIPVQLRWLSIIEQLPDEEKIDLTFAARQLSFPASPDLSLNLFRLQKKMVEKQLCNQAQEWIISFEHIPDETILAVKDPASLIAFLKEEKLPEELQPLKERILSVLEPTLLSQSLLWLSNLTTSWKP